MTVLLSRRRVDMKTNTETEQNRDCGDWRKTCTFYQIETWQLLYVWNALALIAVPLGERDRSTLLMGCHDETKERGVKKRRGMERERGVSKEASECGEKGKSDRRKRGKRDGAIFQAIYRNHQSLINQAFHHRTAQSLLLLAPPPSFHPLSTTHSHNALVFIWPLYFHM